MAAAATLPTALQLAPYYPAEANPRRDHYLVTFLPGHTLAAHFEAIGRVLNINSERAGNRGYLASFDELTRKLVRTDPSVNYVEEDSWGELDDPSCNHHHDTTSSISSKRGTDSDVGYALKD